LKTFLRNYDDLTGAIMEFILLTVVLLGIVAANEVIDH